MKHSLNRLICALLALVMVLAACPGSVRAERLPAAAAVSAAGTESAAESGEVTAEPEADPTIVASGTCGENVTWTLDSAGRLTVEGKGEMVTDEYVAPWYDVENQITSIVIGEGVTSVSKNAFHYEHGSSNVTSVSLPSTLVTIGARAFMNCEFTELTLSEGLVSIGDYAFYCVPITGLVLPDSVTTLGEKAFSGCYKMTSLTLPAALETAGDKVFLSCNSLTDVIMPEMPNLQTLGTGMFLSCDSLTDISWFNQEEVGVSMFAGTGIVELNLPSCVTSIGNLAFSYCDNMTKATIHPGITSVGYEAFGCCDALTVVHFEGDAPSFGGESFREVTSTCYYPEGNKTWTDNETAVKLSDHGGTLTWVAYNPKVASGTCGENVTWTLDSAGRLTVEGTGAVYSYMSGVETPWYNFSEDEITTLVVEEGITSIGSHAFASCKVSQLSLPDSLQTIGGFAFCPKKLTELTIPAGVTSIGHVAFGDSTTLKTIRFLGDAPEMGFECFRKAAAVCYYPFGNSTWTVDSMQQYGGMLTWVSYGTESGCPQSRYGHAYDCVLTPATEDSPAYFIHTCTNCWDTYVEPYNNAAEGMCGEALSWSLEDGNLYLAGSGSMADYASPAFDILNTAPWYSYRSSFTGIAFNGSTDSIGSYAFFDADKLASVVIPSEITSIGEGAFAGCSALKTITFAGDAPTIGTDAFKNVTATCYYPAGNDTWTDDVIQQYGGNLTWVASTDEPQTPTVASGQCGDNVTWTLNNEGLLKIEGTGDMWDYSAQGSNSPGWSSYQTPVKNVMIGEGVTSIGDNTFYNCMSLTSISIPGSVTSIGTSAFYRCSGLTGITIPEGVTSIQYQTFWGCTSLTELTIPNGVTSIGDSAFYSCSGLTEVTIPESVTFIGEAAFQDCSSLKIATIFSSATTIYDYAFSFCSGLTTVYFTGDAPTLGAYAFARTEATCYYPAGNDTWTSDVMQNYGGSLTWEPYSAVIIASGQCGDNLTWTLDSVGELIIEGTGDMWNTGSDELWPEYLDSIKRVIIHEEVTSIGDSAFEGCVKLTTISIPDGVTSIGDSAFECCVKLTTISVPDGVTSIGACVFSGCSGLTNIKMPENVTSIGESAFLGCASLSWVHIPDGVTSVGSSAFSGCAKLDTVSFDGNAPVIGTDAFKNVSAVVLYPVHDATWTEEVLQDYGGNLNWELHDPETNSIVVAHGQCGDNLTWSLDAEGRLAIVGTGEMWRFLSEDSPWYASNSSILSVVIKDGVTSIGHCAFQDCEIMTSVSIPESVTTIDASAFKNCSSLTEISIPEGVTSIGAAAFSGCSRLKEVNIPKGVTVIEASTFAQCSSLTSISIPEHVTTIGGSAFTECSSLTTVNIPENVTSIELFTFYKCPALTDVTIPDGVTFIGDYAFGECDGLTSIKIPFSVTSINEGAFYLCENLTEITFDGNAPAIGTEAFRNVTATCHYPEDNDTWTGNVFNNYGGSLTWEPYSAVIIASGQCGDNLTWTLDSVGELIIEGTGDMWNTGSEKLWPAYLTSIKTVVIGEGVTTIGDYAFYCCSSLTSVSIPEGVTSIGDSGFRGCTSLTDLSIPKGVTIIGMHAFACCTSLTEAHIPEGVTAIQDYTFDSCSALADVTIPDGVTFICDRAFAYCSSLTSVSIPEGVTYIGEYAFVGCSSLTSVSIPEGVTCIGNYAFGDCTSLTEVAIPKGTTTIREGLFWGCTRLAKVSLPDGLTSIGRYSFYSCNSLTELTIPEGVTSIGTDAFCYCKSLTSITIPEGVTSIGDTLFWGCTRLAKVSLPDSLTSIGNFAFCNCNSLTEVYFSGNAPTIGTEAFRNVTANCYYPGVNATWTADVRQQYGGSLTWVAVPGKFNIDFASMTMGNSLAINFAFDKSVMDNWTGCYAEIVKTYADDRADMVVTVPFSQWKSATINGTAHYYVTFNGVAAKEMTDEIRVTIRNADGEAVSNTKKDSVRDQSMRALAKEGVTDEEKTMIVDMLIYGTAAQVYFSYGTDDLACEQLTDEQMSYVSESVPCANNRTSSGSFVASTVVLKSNIQMMFAFSNVDESHYAVVTFTNHRGVSKEITVPGSEFTSNGSARVVTVDALVAADGRQAVTCVVYDANGNEVARVTDSLESYTARSDSEKDLFVMMMRYSDSAYNFFH